MDDNISSVEGGELPPEFAEQIGRVAIASAHLERMVWLFAEKLSGVGQPLAFVLLPDDFTKLTGVIGALSRQRLTQQSVDEIQKVMDQAKKAWPRRSQVIHGLFGTQEGRDGIVRIDLRPLARGHGVDRIGEEVWTTERLCDVVVELRAASDAIFQLHNRLWSS